MDIFIEKLVPRKRRGKDIAAIVGLVFLTILLSLITLMFHEFLFGFWFAIIAGLIFVCYRLISGQNIEFEYSLTNNELDVDRIVARRKRKRLFTVNARQIDILAPISNEQYLRQKNSPSIKRTHDCTSGDLNAQIYFTIFFDKDGQKCLALFEPNEKIIAGFKRYSPKKVFEA